MRKCLLQMSIDTHQYHPYSSPVRWLSSFLVTKPLFSWCEMGVTALEVLCQRRFNEFIPVPLIEKNTFVKKSSIPADTFFL